MARARNIKPAFFMNEELVELRYEVRLLFIGLCTLADKAGRLEDRPKRIKMNLFPADDIDIDAALDDLGAKGFVLRYEVNNYQLIQIVNFLKHQKPHHQEKESELPSPNESEPVRTKVRVNPSDSLNTDSLNPIKHLGESSPGGCSDPKAEAKKHQAELINRGFNFFWEHWPNKKNKIKGRSAFEKRFKKLSREESISLINLIVDDVQKRAQSNQLGFEQMHAATYLNGERWEDSLDEDAA